MIYALSGATIGFLIGLWIGRFKRTEKKCLKELGDLKKRAKEALSEYDLVVIRVALDPFKGWENPRTVIAEARLVEAYIDGRHDSFNRRAS